METQTVVETFQLWHCFLLTNIIECFPGHFTQVVWKNSKALGIGWVQMNDGTTYVVANYEPAGNVIGQYEKNVLPPRK